VKEDEKQTPFEASTSPIDMVVAMGAARELSPEMLIRSAEILNRPLNEAEREKEMEALLEQFNQRINRAYRRKLKDKAQGDIRSADD
jgi:hypothetical protein